MAAADDTDVGEIVSVHRQRWSRGFEAALLAATLAAGGVAVALAAAGLPRTWVALALAYYLVLLLLSLWARRGPAWSVHLRPWFAVAEDGLMVWEATVTVVPWSELRVTAGNADRRRAGVYVCWDQNGQTRQLPVTHVTARDALVRAVRAGCPVPPERMSWRTVASLTTVLALLAAPVMLTLTLGERPVSVEALTRVCAGGAEFGRSAPYRGAGPHPLLVFTEDDGEYGPYPSHRAGTGSGDPPPASVQLVACARLLDDLPGTPLATCEYGPNPYPVTATNKITVYQGRYRVDVYEVRTGRRVASFPVYGQPDRTCGNNALFEQDEKERTVYTQPSGVAYQTRLSPLVTRDAGP